MLLRYTCSRVHMRRRWCAVSAPNKGCSWVRRCPHTPHLPESKPSRIAQKEIRAAPRAFTCLRRSLPALSCRCPLALPSPVA